MADLSLSFRPAHALHVGSGEVVVVRAPVAPLNGEPRVSSSQTSQALAGHALLVLAREGDWLRVRGGDEYEGWVHPGYVAPAEVLLGDASATWYENAVLSLGCRVTGPQGERMLPLGAVLLPGERATAGETVALRQRAQRFPMDAGAVVRSARELFAGTSYQWGGTTPWGADCSGLVQTCFALHGLALPRDAWQQAAMGEEASGEPHALDAADLLFFSDRDDGRITHVGLACGDGRMAHLALGRGGWAMDRLAPPSADADPYVRRLLGTFRLARRLPFAG